MLANRHNLTDRLEKAISLRNSHPRVLSYGLAVITTALLVVLKILISWLANEAVSPFLLMLLAVLVTSWVGGVRPGIFATIISAISIWYFFLPPFNSAVVTNIHRSLFLMAMYLIECLIVIGIVYRKNKAYENMQSRIAQQAIVAAIGQHGLEEKDLGMFMDKVVKAIHKALDVPFVKILELQPDGKMLRLRSGVGWKRGLMNRALVENGRISQAGYTLASSRPVIVFDLKKEKRFVGTRLLHDHNIVSGISIMIPGPNTPYGILSVHTDVKRVFTKEDVNFIRSLANVVATTIERQRIRQEMELLANLNSRLVSSLDPKQTLLGFSQLVVPKFAEVCEIYLNANGANVELIDIVTVNKEKQDIFKEIAKKFPPGENSRRTTARVLKIGRPIFYSVVPSNYPEMIASDKKHAELVKKLEFLSLMSIPLKIRNKTIGAVGLATFVGGNILTERDFQIGKEIANRLAIAVDNAVLYQEARNAVSARDEFLSIASHELKTPLTSMLLQLQTVLHGMKNQSLANFSIEKTMQMLESTIGQSKRLSQLVNDLLNISLITTGRLKLEKENTNLLKVVKEIVMRQDGALEISGSTIDISTKENINVKVDRIRIEQAITNLITNAIKYGEGNPITISITSDGKFVNLAVGDEGEGISRDKQKVIFNRFQRGDVKSSIQGLGVGLYLVNEIVRAHEGTVGVESEMGKGSVFTITLPL